MRPYYSDDLVTLYHGDARDVLPSLEPASIDLVLTDPPYGETTLGWDRTVDGWLDLVRPLMEPSASVWLFASMRYVLELAPSLAGWRFAQDVIWDCLLYTSPSPRDS